MKRGSLEAFFSETGLSSLANLAQSVAVAASVVRQNAPTNLGINVMNTDGGRYIKKDYMIMDEVPMFDM